MMLTVLDLFSGIGGFSLGLERTGGFKTIAFCEKDSYCQKVLAKHWPDTPCHDDITTREFTEGEADVITAGFPCQDISYAGAGAGLAGERSGLWREVVRAIRMVRPRIAVLENVSALLNRGLGEVLADLAEIGYDAEWHCIPASAVGAPHRRDRIWIVAYPNGAGLEGRNRAILQECSSEWTARPSSPSLGNATGVNDEYGGYGSGPLFWEKQKAANLPRGEQGERGWSGWWRIEPPVGRVADGIPRRVDRLRSLGNSVVPQVITTLGYAILEKYGRSE